MTRMFSRLFVAAGAALLIAGCSQPQETVPQTADYDATYYLVRHAEKLTGDDPALTPEGTLRAEALRQRLSGTSLSAIYSSDYKRTQDTAAPIAAAQNLSVISYDPRDLPGIAEVLKNQSGSILVVGHSNTTPQLAELLGGEPGEPIVEATEYDRLYIITRSGETVEGRIERYGAKSP